MNTVTKTIVSLVIVASLAAPVLTHAAGLTPTQISSVISLLQSFGVATSTINNVRDVLNGKNNRPMSIVPPGQVGKRACVTLMRDLRLGSKGDDVRRLQDMLRDDDDARFTAPSTGSFGPLTMAALKRFQIRNGIASTSTGTVGPATRGFFQRRCGMGLGKRDRGQDDIASTTITTQTPRPDDDDDR